MLLFVDNIFRFTQAGSEVSALLGRIPSAVGYQPTLATEMGNLQERITSTNKGSITSVQAIYVPADDLTDPAPATSFAHLDATTVLSRDIAAQAIFPAVDPLRLHQPRIMDPLVIGEEHYAVARRGPGNPAAVQGAEGHHRHPGHGRAVEEDKLTVARARKIQRFLSPAVPRRRAVHQHARRSSSQLEGHHPLVQGHRGRRVRPPAGSRLLHGRRASRKRSAKAEKLAASVMTDEHELINFSLRRARGCGSWIREDALIEHDSGLILLNLGHQEGGETAWLAKSIRFGPFQDRRSRPTKTSKRPWASVDLAD